MSLRSRVYSTLSRSQYQTYMRSRVLSVGAREMSRDHPRGFFSLGSGTSQSHPSQASNSSPSTPSTITTLAGVHTQQQSNKRPRLSTPSGHRNLLRDDQADPESRHTSARYHSPSSITRHLSQPQESSAMASLSIPMSFRAVSGDSHMVHHDETSTPFEPRRISLSTPDPFPGGFGVSPLHSPTKSDSKLDRLDRPAAALGNIEHLLSPHTATPPVPSTSHLTSENHTQLQRNRVGGGGAAGVVGSFFNRATRPPPPPLPSRAPGVDLVSPPNSAT